MPMESVPAAAREVGVGEEEIIKSLVVAGPSESVAVAVLGGDRVLELDRVATAQGWPSAELADRPLAREATGFPPGGTPPIGHARPIPVLLDEALLDLPRGFAGGGRPELLLVVRPRELAHLDEVTVTKIARSPS